MSTTELIFNSTKFYPVADSDTSLTANNKKFLAMPTEITIPTGFLVNLDTSMHQYGETDSFCLKDDHTAKVVAVGEDDYIVHPQQNWYSNTYELNYIDWLKVPKNQAKNVKW